MKIGIMGAPIDNPNHGCMALLYSLLFNLNAIERESDEDFQYVIFDWKFQESSFKILSEQLSIDREKLIFAPYVMLLDPFRFVYHIKDFFRMVIAIKKCDCIIDVTEGDSFSDIYGDAWLSGRTRVKILIEKMGVPLLLAPQTYGPYLKEKNRILACRSIRGADCVMTRDKSSQKLIKEITDVEAIYTTDLAFALPCKEYDIVETGKIKVGINASNLLYYTNEMKERKFTLLVDYAEYLQNILQFLFKENLYDVYFISHVDGDYEVHEKLKEMFPKANLVPKFTNPIQAKSCISKMDIFIGARMHGTIAAFTTGVACIPTSYSPKFIGLFSSVGYSPIVDLTSLSTEEACKLTEEYICQYKVLKEQIQKCINNEELMSSTKVALKKWLMDK